MAQRPNSTAGAPGSGAGATTTTAGAPGQSTTAATPTRSTRASTLPIRGGKREVKAYALTEDELSTLGALQGLAAFFFALGGTCLGLWFNIELQVAFADDVEKHVTSYWEGLQFAAIVAAFIFGALGVVIFAYNGWRVRRIKKSTLH